MKHLKDNVVIIIITMNVFKQLLNPQTSKFVCFLNALA